MAETNTSATGVSGSAGADGTSPAKARFAAAIQEAKAGVQELGKEAQARAGGYREKASASGSEWMDEAKVLGSQAKERATGYAVEGKARACEAMTGLSKLVEENAPTIDEKLGVKYGDYARKAATSMQDAATRLDAKDLDELGEDAREFVRKSPGLAVGMAAVAGYMLARIFRGGR